MAYSHGYVKRTFFTGQYDREFSGQENAITAAGMVYCKNVLTSPQGECKTRPGTEFLLNVDSEAVIIPYRRAGQDLLLLFSDSKLDVKTFDADGNLIDFIPSTLSDVVWTNTDNNTPSSTPVSITGDISGDTSLAYNFWSSSVYDLTSNYATNRLYVPQKTYPRTFFNMQFTTPKAINQLSFELMQADGNWSAEYQQNVKSWINNAVLQYSDDGNNWFSARLVQPVYWTDKRESTVNGTIPIPRLRFDLLQTATHEYWRVVIVWNRQQMLNNAPFLAHFTDVKEETQGQVQTFSSPYTVDLLKKLKYSQQYGQLLICDGVHNPYLFSMTGSSVSFIEKTYSFMTETETGVPSCVRFFQNRLYFGGFVSFPNKVIASRFGDYTYSDFTVETSGATVASPINVDCNQFSERITDLWGGFEVLYAQSSEGIAFVTGMSATPNFTLRCSERASGITPTMKDNIMYYVGYDRRKIYAFSFDNNIQQFVAPDISRFWQEVLKDRISEIHYVDSRSKCIVGCLESGSGFFLFHEGRDAGYFPFDINGYISDISIVKDGDDSHIIMIVQRNGKWMIERLHLPEFMRSTNSFEQSNMEKNLNTQKNLLKSPFFDSWHVAKNEHIELWNYNAETKIISPMDGSDNPVDLSGYVGSVVRFYYGDDIRDYVDAKIERVFTEQRTEERKIEVESLVTYYGWAYTSGITVQGISGQDPYVNGYLSRNASADEDHNKGWYYSPLNRNYWTNTINPSLGDRLYDRVQGTSRTVTKGTITALNRVVYWTKSITPHVGDAVYNSNYEQIGSVSSVSGNNIVVNNNTLSYDSNSNMSREERHTETIEVVVESGEYAVDCDLNKNIVFTKIQLPIEEFITEEKQIQLQDNGVYRGEFQSETENVTLYEWVYNNTRVYTETTTPQRGDNVFDVYGRKIGIVSGTGTNTITYNNNTYELHTETVEVGRNTQVYGWYYPTKIRISILDQSVVCVRGDGNQYTWVVDGGSREYHTTTPFIGVNVPIRDSVDRVGSITEIIEYESLFFTEDSQSLVGQRKITPQGQITDEVITGSLDTDYGRIVCFDAGVVYYSRYMDADQIITIQETEEQPVKIILSLQKIKLDEPVYNAQYGVPYRKIAVVEDNRSYLRQKGWGAIAVNIIDTMSLKVGIKLDKMTNMIKWDGKQFFDSNLIMKNGTLICNIKDVPQYEKQLIFVTDDGLPFTLLAIETAGEISDRGAN